MSAGLDSTLCRALCEHPRRYRNRFTTDAKNALLETLFRALTNDNPHYLRYLFPSGELPPSYRLQDAQGTKEDAEYTEAARGQPCGHIFKHGEANYHCITCTDDPTAVLCARCFIASDHAGHQFHIISSQGNSGCCDCGDNEAWKRPVHCAIHTSTGDPMSMDADEVQLPDDLQAAIRITIARVLDYFCDIISCSPENLRLPKTEDSVRQDEVTSRLEAQHYETSDPDEPKPEYCLVLWNDEKHTIREVQDQVVRACREREVVGRKMAEQANDFGRCVIRHSTDLEALLHMAKIIDQIKITVTVRSSRDTFREQMCETIIEWLQDIAACQIQGHKLIFRRTICTEMLGLWRIGTRACNARVGREGIEDHAYGEGQQLQRALLSAWIDPIRLLIQEAEDDTHEHDEDDDEDDVDDDDDDDDNDNNDDEDEEMDDRDSDVGDEREYVYVDDAATSASGVAGTVDPEATDDGDEMDTDGDIEFSDGNDRLRNNQAPPLPPPTNLNANEPAIAANAESLSRQESEELNNEHSRNYRNVPKTPKSVTKPHGPTPNHWTAVSPEAVDMPDDVPAYEDLRKNIRVDSMILFDLRLWKQARISLRDLLITTVINVPEFKRILGLRFAGLYTTLAQLHLVADREPDHSIINLSLQLLTVPSITEEVVQKADFLTILIAILYTFLTTRQVGYPGQVDPGAILGYDAGSVTNRRLYHFFHDLIYFLASPFVQARIRSEKRYLFQFLDLAKLSQGICPNLRAVGEHVEYETDAWISASLLTREINKLCRQFSEAFAKPEVALVDPNSATYRVIFDSARAAIANSLGLERQRFEHSEIRDVVKFHAVGPYVCDPDLTYKVVQFVVERSLLSFHHPLHYTLSWLLEGGRHARSSINALQAAADEFVPSLNLHSRGTGVQAAPSKGEDALLALFDYPLRVCAWLAQMRPNLWVRNGHSLRHQMEQYKSVANRDSGYHRDLFLLQTALVSCNPGRVLASMVDRFGMQSWLSGRFDSISECEDAQMVDVVEEFVYLIINLLSDRDSLMSPGNDKDAQLMVLRTDIVRTLCFKPLSFSILNARLPERAQVQDQLQEVLESMTTYRAPEGLSDTGVFELKDDYLQELDPYNSHFSKNQRDEAENIYKAWKAKKLNRPVDDIVLEPKLYPIRSEAYLGLCDVVHERLFANVIHALLTFTTTAKTNKTAVTTTRIEAFLNILLHLILVATLEDKTNAREAPDQQSSFVHNALSIPFRYPGETAVSNPPATIAQALYQVWTMDDFSACRSKVRHILQLFNQKSPVLFLQVNKDLDLSTERSNTASPAPGESGLENKKKQAMARKAKIMAQMQQQQQSFMDKQGVVDWGDEELDEEEAALPAATEKRIWKFPSGVCIQCREETNDSRLYGTFAMVSDAHVLRQTPVQDPDLVQEVCATPLNLDRSLEHERPFGISGANHEQIPSLSSTGEEVLVDRQGLGKGWPHRWTQKGPVSTSCGHIMHYACFGNYYQSIIRRHSHQIARNHSERVALKEFVCPLCKALANTFLPIVWKSSEQSYPGALSTGTSFDIFLDYALPTALQQHSTITASGNLEIDQFLHVHTIRSFNTQAMLPLVQMLDAEGFRTDLSARPIDQHAPPGMRAFAELSAAYTRLRESLSLAETSYLTEDLWRKEGPAVPVDHFDMLVQTLANSVAASEIASRGKEAPYGGTLVEVISPSTLSHLQILASSVQAYAAMSALAQGSSFAEPYRALFAGVLRRLLQSDTQDSTGTVMVPPPLETDAFTLFVQTSVTICRLEPFPVHHMLRLCLLLELMRVVAALAKDSTSTLPRTPAKIATPDVPEQALTAVHMLLQFVHKHVQSNSEETVPEIPSAVLAILARAMKSYTLTFLRKAAIFLHVACGMDFPNTVGSEAAATEVDRLSRLLKLPDIFTIMTDFSEYSGQYTLHKLATRWIMDSLCDPPSPTTALRCFQPIRLLHPAPLELIGLPKYFDVLIAESHKRKCPTTGKELTDPALCLFCGEIFCAQAVCCMIEWRQGGCNQHLLKCSYPIGLFLFIRKCHVVMLHVVRDPRKIEASARQVAEGGKAVPFVDMTISHGTYHIAPYLTKHGEPDSGLRTKHQLILSQKRYDKLLRDTWLMINGSVWSTVARKLEMEVNAGGWESL